MRDFLPARMSPSNYCTCIVLKGWSMLPNALRPFQIYCAPPNLDIMTWICRLNFAQRPISSGLRFFNEPEISDCQLKVTPGGLVLRIFMSWKNPSTSARFEPTNLGSQSGINNVLYEAGSVKIIKLISIGVICYQNVDS